jgi:hypothetical protein
MSGIAWHGAMFIQRYVPVDGSEVNPDEYVISYCDDITVGRCPPAPAGRVYSDACCSFRQRRIHA